jgi:hypothetical protein
VKALKNSDSLDRGIVSNVGRKWQEQHKFMMTTLKEFGFGKSSMEEMINNEVENFKIFLEEKCDRTISVQVYINGKYK